MSEANRQLPSADDILSLPCWARVAFAARCARRVRPVYAGSMPELLDTAIRAAEESAARGMVSPEYAPLFGDRVRAAYKESCGTISEAAVLAAAKTGDALGWAHAVLEGKYSATESGFGGAVVFAADIILWLVEPSVVAADFATVREAVRRERWGPTSPAPPSVFGPMWPEGEPPGWPRVGMRGTKYGPRMGRADLVPGERYLAVCTPHEPLPSKFIARLAESDIFTQGDLCAGVATGDLLNPEKPITFIWPQICVLCCSAAIDGGPVVLEYQTRVGNQFGGYSANCSYPLPICRDCRHLKTTLTTHIERSPPAKGLLAYLLKGARERHLEAVRQSRMAAEVAVWESFPEFRSWGFDQLTALYHDVYCPADWRIVATIGGYEQGLKNSGLAFINADYAREFCAANKLPTYRPVKHEIAFPSLVERNVISW